MPYLPLSLAPARTAAATLVNRLDLHPPVKVHDLVSNYAELEQVNWPGENVDAVMLRRGTEKPMVFYKSHDPRGLRERFTLGHELGHLILPWQIGNATCVVSDDVQDSVSSDEAEANMFASC
jgi:Zn-dependent peptidase ImmA (M78 family)